MSKNRLCTVVYLEAIYVPDEQIIDVTSFEQRIHKAFQDIATDQSITFLGQIFAGFLDENDKPVDGIGDDAIPKPTINIPIKVDSDDTKEITVDTNETDKKLQ